MHPTGEEPVSPSLHTEVLLKLVIDDAVGYQLEFDLLKQVMLKM